MNPPDFWHCSWWNLKAKRQQLLFVGFPLTRLSLSGMPQVLKVPRHLWLKLLKEVSQVVFAKCVSGYKS